MADGGDEAAGQAHGLLEVTKEGRGIVMRVPLEGGGRLVVELSPDEAVALGEALEERPSAEPCRSATDAARLPAPRRGLLGGRPFRQQSA